MFALLGFFYLSFSDFGRLPLGPVLGHAAPLGRGTTFWSPSWRVVPLLGRLAVAQRGKRRGSLPRAAAWDVFG